MIAKGTSEYKKAGEISNELLVMASRDRWNNNSSFEYCFNTLAFVLADVIKVGGFAADVATTVEKSMNPYNRSVANLSSKQAWVIACSIVENGIKIGNEVEELA